MLAYYSDSDDAPDSDTIELRRPISGMRVIPQRCIPIGEPVYFLTDADLVDSFLDQTQVHTLPEVLQRLFQALQEGDTASAEAWSELAIKQGCKPSGAYRMARRNDRLVSV